MVQRRRRYRRGREREMVAVAACPNRIASVSGEAREVPPPIGDSGVPG
jgi:hypothetical protein